MSDACGLPCKYGDAPKTQAGLMCLFEELCIVYCSKERNALLPQWAGLCCGQLDCTQMPNSRLKLKLESWKKS